MTEEIKDSLFGMVKDPIKKDEWGWVLTKDFNRMPVDWWQTEIERRNKMTKEKDDDRIAKMLDDMMPDLYKTTVNGYYAHNEWRTKMTEEIKDPLYEDQWNLKMLNVEEAWKYATGKGVVVGLIDSGVDASHQDLGWHEHIELSAMDSYAAIKGKLMNVHLTILREEHPKILPGWNFINDSDFTFDFFRHGTAMAGIIAADRDNIGIVGVAPDCKIRPYVVLNNQGYGNQVNVAKAIRMAMDDGCDIINMSLAFRSSSQETLDATLEAAKAGIILIAAAGNDKKNHVSYPARYGRVISVGACDSHGKLWVHSDDRGSNYGDGLFCLCPGGAQPTTQRLRSRWNVVDATSAAAANMTGIAALIKEVRPNDGHYLLHNLVMFGKEWDKYIGYGVPDAADIIKRSMLPVVEKPLIEKLSPSDLDMFIAKIHHIEYKLGNLKSCIKEFVEDEQ